VSHPIFFSVASDDVELAERIFARYARDLIYLYSKNGRNGTWMWDEIEKDELPFSKAFIIFWSKSYIRNTGTLRELVFAKAQLERGLLRQFAIIRCDNTPIILSDSDEHLYPDLTPFDALRPFVQHVRAERPPSLEHAEQIIDAVVAKVERASIPLQPRPNLQQDLKDSARIDHFTYRPCVWVSGLNGYGRKTLIGELMREVDPNTMPSYFDVDETTLPGQLAARIESRIFDAPLDQLNDLEGDPVRVSELIDGAATAGRYVVLRQNRVYEEGIELPEWLESVISGLSIARIPKLFIVSQLPVGDDLLSRCGDKLAAFRMRAMEPDAAEEFVWKLISALRGSPSQWDQKKVDSIIAKSGGTPELMIAIVKVAVRMSDLTKLEEVIGYQAAQFSDTMASLVGWAFRQLDGFDYEKRALLFLNDVSPVTLRDIQLFIGGERPASIIVSKLASLALVERTDDDLYRLSPLLSRRLSSLLTTRELVAWHREAIGRFVSRPFEVSDGEDGFLQVETRIKAELYSGKAAISPELRRYVSHAHYFQIGIRLYNARRYRDAFRILKLAFENRSVFDFRAAMEVARFYCLAAIRLRDQAGAIGEALMFLRSRYQGQSMADFLEGERLRYDHKYDEAIKFFAKAQAAAKQNKERYREERILRPYLESILRCRSPNLAKAKELADRNVRLNRTFFSLSIRVRVYLNLWLAVPPTGQEEAKSAYMEVLQELERQPGAFSFYAQARAEEAEAFGEFEEAIDWARQAVEVSARFDVRLKLWGIQLRSNLVSERRSLIREIEEFCSDPANRVEIGSYARPIAERYAKALKVNGDLKQFRIGQLGLPLSSGEIRSAFLSANERFQSNWLND